MSNLRPTLVVNAGGQSRRMGQPKALLPVPPHGTPLLAHIIARLRRVVAEGVTVVSNDPVLAERAGLTGKVTVIADAWPDAGTLGGIGTALQHVQGWALIVACDLPLVSAPLCAHLATLAGAQQGGDDLHDAVVPVVGGYEEPLHALYHRRCLPWIEAALARGERRVISFFPHVRVRRVDEVELRSIDPELRSFVNVNTPDEWADALRLLTEEEAA